MSRQTLLYGTYRDQEDALDAIESIVTVRYISIKDHDSEEIPTYTSYRQIPDWGLERFWPYGFLVMPQNEEPKITVVRLGSNRKFECDPAENFKSIYFIPMHDACDDGKRVLFGGKVGTAFANKESLNLYDTFRKEFVHRFIKIDRSFLVGPEANQLGLERSTAPI